MLFVDAAHFVFGTLLCLRAVLTENGYRGLGSSKPELLELQQFETVRRMSPASFSADRKDIQCNRIQSLD